MAVALLATVLYATPVAGYVVECFVQRRAMRGSYMGVPERIPPTRAMPTKTGEAYCYIEDPLPGQVVMFCVRSVDPNNSARVSDCVAPPWPVPVL